MDRLSAARARGVFTGTVDAVLGDRGFVRGGTWSWLRSGDDLEQIIAFPSHAGRRALQWGLGSAGASRILSGDDAKPGDVAWSVVTVRAGDVLETHHGGFELVGGMDGSDAEQIASGAALDAGRVADWLTGVSSSRQLCALLVPGSRHPFTVPGSDSLIALTRAAVAVVGELPEPATWVEEAEVACARFKAKEMQDRLLRLRRALQAQR